MTTPAPLSSTVLRTNLAIDPSATANTSAGSSLAWAPLWYGASGSGTTTLITGVVGAPVTTAMRKTWTVGSPSGDTGFGHSNKGVGGWPVTAGQTYTFSSYMRTSAASGRTGTIRVFWYNAAGTLLSNPGGSAVALNAGWSLVSGTFTAPAGATSAAVWSDAGGVAFTAGETLDGTALLAEVGATLGGYFDGDSLNAVWNGAVHGSTSTLTVLSQNPAMPVIEFAAWPGVSPAAAGVPASQPTILSDRAKAFKITRGRQYELSQDQAASGSVTLNNHDGQITGGANGCIPLVTGRLQARWGGVTYPVWVGPIRSWPQQDDNPSMAWSKAELTDSFEPLANHKFQSLIAEEIRYDTVPDLWYPMNEPSSSTSIGSLVPGGPSAPLVSFKGGSVPFALGATSPFAGTSETVLGLANATGATNHASQYQVVGPQNPSGYSMPFGQPWGVGVFVRVTAGASVVWSALDTDGTVMAALLVSPTTVTGYERMGGPGASYVTMPCATSAAVNGCYVHLGHDGTNAFIYVYGVTSDGSLYALTAGGAEPITTGTSRWVAWGQAFKSDAIYYSSNADMQMCHGTIWTTAPPAPYSNQIIGIATAALGAFYSYKSKDVVSYLAAYAGLGTHGDPIDGQVLGETRDTNGASALDGIRAATLDYLGRVFMSKDGLLTWQSVHHAMGQPNQWTLGGQPGEYPYAQAPQFDYDPTYVYNDVQVNRQNSRGAISGTQAIQRATDAASAASYFQRVLQIDANIRFDADALSMAQYLLNKYRNPATRVRTVRFEPSSNPALWPFVLGAELGDTVTMNHRALGRPTVTLSLSIQQITHTVDAQAGTWITEMELTPWSSDWALAAMHTTINGTFGAGVTSLQIKPLPDAATNSAEQSLGVGTTITLGKGTANEETLTIASVASLPTANATGYTSIAVGFTAATAHPHANGEVVCDPLPTGVTDPTTWDAFSVLDSTTVVSI